MVQGHQPSRVEWRKPKTRLALSEDASDLVDLQGIYWAPIKDIPAHANIGKGTFYQNFPTKESLPSSLLAEELQRLQERISHDIHISFSANVLHTATKTDLEFYPENPENRSLFHQIQGLLRPKNRTTKELWEIYDRLFDRLGELLASTISPPKRLEQARDLAIPFSALTSGLLTHRFPFSQVYELTRHRHDRQAQVERTIEAIV